MRLAIFAAESVLKVFERKHPDDKRPQQAIEAAKAWLDGKGTARAAYAAADAAADSAYAAYAAARAAYAAAYAAADSAYAAYASRAAARAAAAYAADAGTKAQIHRLVLQMIEEAQNETNS